MARNLEITSQPALIEAPDSRLPDYVVINDPNIPQELRSRLRQPSETVILQNQSTLTPDLTQEGKNHLINQQA